MYGYESFVIYIFIVPMVVFQTETFNVGFASK